MSLSGSQGGLGWGWHTSAATDQEHRRALAGRLSVMGGPGVCEEKGVEPPPAGSKELVFRVNDADVMKGACRIVRGLGGVRTHPLR